jgi:pilus assembly protein CpaB
MVEVLVAARAIRAGERVGTRNVRWQRWPRKAIVPGSLYRQPGHTGPSLSPAPARYPILAGEPIAESKLLRPGSGGVLASLVAPGMRAISIPIHADLAANNLVQPQDRVDVLIIRKNGRGAHTKSELLYRAAKVVALGKGISGHGRTVTLELPASELPRLASALTNGEISIAVVAAGEKNQKSHVEPSKTTAAVAVMKFGRPHHSKASEF